MSDVLARPPGQAVELAPALRLRRPSWRDRRLVIGVLLVLGSTVAGMRLLGADPATVDVWVATRDLGSGTHLRADDLIAASVRVAGSTTRYVDARAVPPAGHVLVRPVGAGELLPAAALSTDAAAVAATRVVSVPVEHGRLPADLARGERVDVYVTPSRSGEEAEALQVAQGAVVTEVDAEDGRFGAGSADVVLLTVAAEAVPRLVGGLSRGTVDVVRIPSGSGA